MIMRKELNSTYPSFAGFRVRAYPPAVDQIKGRTLEHKRDEAVSGERK
jgi:hypothetical protein